MSIRCSILSRYSAAHWHHRLWMQWLAIREQRHPSKVFFHGSPTIEPAAAVAVADGVR